MRLQLRCHGDIDLSQPGMQVEIRSHIARCLRDYPNGGEGVITLAGVEHCFMYVVQNDVVDTVIGVVPENSIRLGWRDEVESAHHPMRCLRSSTCLERMSPICSSRGAGLKSRTSFFVIS